MDIPETIQCTPREPARKGAAHKLRAQGRVPVVAYGPGKSPRHLAADAKLFFLQRVTYGLSRVYNVEVAGQESFKALIKEMQLDPVTQALLHVDLYTVDMTRKIKVPVLVELTGKPVGVVDGGLLQHILRTVEVQCLPDRVPAKLSVDVSALKIGGAVHLSDIKLPEGVEFTSRSDEAVATVVPPEAEEVAAAVVPAEGELAAAVPGAEGEAAAAAPAAGAEGAAPAEAGKAGAKPAGAGKAAGGAKSAGKEAPEKGKKGKKED